MKKYNLRQFNKKVLCILILFVMIYTMLNIIPQTTIKSYGATYTYTNNSNDLPSDFDAKYPNYRTLVNTLAVLHPNWTFKLYETGLDWNTVLNYESQHGKNLVEPGYYTPDWGCSCNVAYDGVWKCASRAAVEYMMDPRHFLNGDDIFQFQDLSASSGDSNAIASMIAGTFMDTDAHRGECIQAIMESAQQYGISPYFITSKIIQEQGTNGSVLSSGEGYNGNYVGYYNLFNIGAYPTESGSTIENGLKYAQDSGWDSMYKSIKGGAQFIKESYIKYGQTTVYYQKYNVVNKNNLYGNQYMTNVWGAYSEGKIMRSKYAKCGILESNFTFNIPLYVGMPAMELDFVSINADPSLKLKAGPSSNSEHLISVNNNTIVLRVERANSKVDGYYWDKVITPYGTGYMARNALNNSKLYLVPLTFIEPTNNYINLNENNAFTEPDSNNIITTEPNTTVNKLKEKYSNAVVIDKNGKEIKGDTLVGTNSKVKIDGVEKYTIVKLGDINGDGAINTGDTFLIKQAIMNIKTIEDLNRKAADLNKDNEINTGDSFVLKKYVMKIANICL